MTLTLSEMFISLLRMITFRLQKVFGILALVSKIHDYPFHLSELGSYSEFQLRL